MSFLSTLPPSTNLMHVFKAFSHTSKPLLEFHEVLLRGPSPFSEAERERQVSVGGRKCARAAQNGAP
jgi:hypothetical protein